MRRNSWTSMGLYLGKIIDARYINDHAYIHSYYIGQTPVFVISGTDAAMQITVKQFSNFMNDTVIAKIR